MVLKPRVCVLWLWVIIMQLGCGKTPPPLDMSIADSALNEYCKSENLASCDFNSAHVYREQQYDWCVEYITKTNCPRKHVLLLFFKNNKIVENHRFIEPEP